MRAIGSNMAASGLHSDSQAGKASKTTSAAALRDRPVKMARGLVGVRPTYDLARTWPSTCPTTLIAGARSRLAWVARSSNCSILFMGRHFNQFLEFLACPMGLHLDH